jgi:hypothetical protein
MGLEPTTSTLQRSHSSQLSYAPVSDRTGLPSIPSVPADLGTIAHPVLFSTARYVADQGLREHCPASSHAPLTVSVTQAAAQQVGDGGCYFAPLGAPVSGARR